MKIKILTGALLLIIAGLVVALAKRSNTESSPAPPPVPTTGTPPGGPEKTVTGAEPFHGLVQYRDKDAKQAIFKPEFVKAADARLVGGTSVIGVSIEGESRAYPLYLLTNHQIVNDEVGGKSIACSW